MDSIGNDFIQKTKYQHLNISDQMKGISPPPIHLSYSENMELIPLPGWDHLSISRESIATIMDMRESVRNYKEEEMSLAELSYLLWFTQGIKETIGEIATKRTVPSAGARHALETTLLINRVTGLDQGLYHYSGQEHQLGISKKGSSIAEEIVKASFGQDFIQKSAVTFIWSTVIYRMKWRYGERAYRYIFLDAGHVAQNLYLSSESIGYGACAIAAFSDDDMNRILGLDGKEQFVIYMAAVGKKRGVNHLK